MIFFGETLGFGYSLLTGSFTLTLMVLPLITRNTQEALRQIAPAFDTVVNTVPAPVLSEAVLARLRP